MFNFFGVAKSLVGLIFGVLTALLSLVFGAGCISAGKTASLSDKQVALTASLDGLRQANFEGEIDFQEGGSFLGINYGTFASLGPKESNLHIRGKVDFTKTPRAAETSPDAKQTGQ